MKKEYTTYYCDLCEKEVAAHKVKHINIETNSRWIDLDLCEDCMNKHITPIFKNIAHNQKWSFKSVGNCEQGGILCPVCGELNNMYTFEGTCAYCGYEDKEWKRF